MHVAYEDAEAYAAWAGLSLPTEAEWETAARGGLEGATYTWGDDPEQPGERLANYWHGDFPWRPDRATAAPQPVGSFPPNGYGLFDMAGNVWEWTTDWYADIATTAIPVARRAVTTRASHSSWCRARSSRVGRSYAPTTTACATVPPPVDRSRSIPA